MTYIQRFLESGECEEKEEKMMREKSARFVFIGRYLYRRGYAWPLLKCISKDEVVYIMDEIHEGVCNIH